MKKIFFILIGCFSFLQRTYAFDLFNTNNAGYGFGTKPTVNCYGLPGCNNVNDPNIVLRVSENIISELIKFVAVFAVIALVISGIIYILSGGDEAKTKKAKNWIIWSLVGVFLSISAWTIINVINNFSTYNTYYIF